MQAHILAGDALAYDLRKTNIDGETVICRECLIVGDVQGETLEEFWQTRAKFIETAYHVDQESYFIKTVGEFNKLRNLESEQTEINLWFEYELFCQVNLWFCLYFLRGTKAKLYRVAPCVRITKDVWKGFGKMTSAEMETCYSQRERFSAEEIKLGATLWETYRDANHAKLLELSTNDTACLPYLREVCLAETEKQTRPPAILKEIIAGNDKTFAEIFSEFTKQTNIYGYGDTQVKDLLKQLKDMSS